VPKLFLGEGAARGAWREAQGLLGESPAGHPDLLAVSPKGASIGIDQVREAIRWARYGPVRAPGKVVLIGPAEYLSHEAASALLKTLEEAPGYLSFILYSVSPDLLLPTVRSRCAPVWPPSLRELWRRELKAASYQEHEIDLIMGLIQGEDDVSFFTKEYRPPGRAWEEAEDEVAGLSLVELAERFPGWAGDPIRRRVLAMELAGRLLQAPADEVLLSAEKLAASGREVALGFLRELLHSLLTGRSPLPSEQLVAWARKISLAKGELEANANVKLLVEVILLWPRRG